LARSENRTLATSHVTKKSIIVLSLIALLLGGVVALCPVRIPRVDTVGNRERERVAAGIVATPLDSHRLQPSLASDGTTRIPSADSALADALSITSRLDYDLRLKTVHALNGATLSPSAADVLRAFVANPDIPEGLTIQQVRALKNDVLNVLCVYPGGEVATAAMLRAVHSDETQDGGLRDYALQHLVTLSERDPSLGWSAHWVAIDDKNTALAATAMIHLSGLHRRGELTPVERAHLETAALRLASDNTAKAPTRTTAIQICGQLKLTEARSLAAELARSDQVSIPLRIAAVATLGDLGDDTATRDYLTALADGPEKRLRLPAQSALKRFSIN
jgi:hypothetical protein